ncbi:FR47-like protein [Williamsia sterculiae]|uniref:FR47-like protein n=1 Tax=Williamsia sterculiae TaxID=1344003 RepID=A0A1N7ENQ6_9NOCA|nr:FR47-like protein [Williamsia sterculiae]
MDLSALSVCDVSGSDRRGDNDTVLTPLDNPVVAAANGPQRDLTQWQGSAVRYLPDVSPFAGFADPHAALDPHASAWADLAELIGPGSSAALPWMPDADPADVLPDGWSIGWSMPGVQMVDTLAADRMVDPHAVRLTTDDVPAMLDLVALTRPGPFLDRTIDLGRYHGVWADGTLIAMAGERMHAPGFREISAICTHPDHRGRGLAARLTATVAAGIQADGETPFLHASASNVGAVRLYERLGFRLRRRLRFISLVSPE